MHHWKPYLLLLLLSPAVAAENLLEIYQQALQNDPTYRAARAQLKAGLEEEKLGLAGLLPRMEFNAGYSQSFTQSRGQFPAGGLLIPNRTDRGIEAKNWGVTLQQPVFDLTAWFTFERGKTLSEAARVQFAAASQDLILRVAEAYVAVLRAMADLEAAEALEKATTRQLEQARERFQVGLTAVTDVREAEAAHDSALAQRIAAEGALKVSRENLAVLTGTLPSAPLAVLGEDYPVSAPDPEDPRRWVEFAKTHNYDIRSAALALQAAGQRARAAAAEHLPKVNANLGYSETRSDVDFHNLSPQSGDRYAFFPSNSNQGSFSLNLNLPLFAGGGISAARRKAYAEKEQAGELHLRAVRTTVQGTRAEYINVVTGAAQVRARQRAVESSRTSLEATESGYEVGTRTIVDVLIAIQNYHAAVRDLKRARLDYLLATLRLKRLAGTLSPADLAEINRRLVPPEGSALHSQTATKLTVHPHLEHPRTSLPE